MKLSHWLLTIICVLLLSISSTVPANAAQSGLDISVNGSTGITINPGEYPDLNGDLDNVQSEVTEIVTSKAKQVAQTITGICTIICFCAFFYSVTKLSTSASMPLLRRQALVGVLWSGIALALFGGAWIVVAFFWNFFTT